MKNFLMILITLYSCSIYAQSISIHNLNPGYNTKFVRVETPTQFALSDSFEKPYFLGISFDYVDDPLININQDTGKRNNTVVDGLYSLNFLVGYQFFKNIGLFADVPLHSSKFLSDIFNPQLTSSSSTYNSIHLGDIRTNLKILLLNQINETNQKRWSLALIPQLSFGTGKKPPAFTSYGGLRYGGSLSLERDFGNMILAANLGYLYGKNAIYEAANYTKQIPYSFGLLYPLSKKVGINLEWDGSLTPNGTDYQNTGEVYLGTRFKILNTIITQIGGSFGKFNLGMSSDWRAHVAIKYTPHTQPQPITTPIPVIATSPTLPPLENKITSTLCSEIAIIHFANASYQIILKDQAKLKKFSETIKSGTSTVEKIIIEGHASPNCKACSTPAQAKRLNDQLALKRATITKEFMIQLGVPENIIQTKIYGDNLEPTGIFTTKKEKEAAWRRALITCQ